MISWERFEEEWFDVLLAVYYLWCVWLSLACTSRNVLFWLSSSLSPWRQLLISGLTIQNIFRHVEGCRLTVMWDWGCFHTGCLGRFKWTLVHFHGWYSSFGVVWRVITLWCGPNKLTLVRLKTGRDLLAAWMQTDCPANQRKEVISIFSPPIQSIDRGTEKRHSLRQPCC